MEKVMSKLLKTCGRSPMSKCYMLFLTLILLPYFAFGEGFGSNGLTRVQSATTLKPQRLEFRTNMKFFTKVADFLGQTKPSNFTVVNYWDVQSNALLTYGLAEHFDATVTTRVYQDVHKSDKEFNSPDDIFVDLKAGSFGLSNNKFSLGGIATFRFPTGEVHNYPFETYTAGSVEFGFTFLFSYFKDPFLPYRDLSIHVNLGWYNHNDAGKTLLTRTISDTSVLEFKAQNNATAVRWGLGVAYPTELFDLNLELWGNHYINKPDSLAFSRENFVYMTPSIKFKPRWWINFMLGLDVRVSADKDESSPLVSFVGQNLNLPNYPSWKLSLGMNVVLNAGTEKIRGGVGEKSDIRKKVDFYERLLKEKEKTRSIEEELRRLKREREQAERELEELRQLLEEEGK